MSHINKGLWQVVYRLLFIASAVLGAYLGYHVLGATPWLGYPVSPEAARIIHWVYKPLAMGIGALSAVTGYYTLLASIAGVMLGFASVKLGTVSSTELYMLITILMGLSVLKLLRWRLYVMMNGSTIVGKSKCVEGGRECLVLSVVTGGLGYLLVVFASYYVGILTYGFYNWILVAPSHLPEPLSTFLQLLLQSILFRAVTLVVIITLIGYIANRLLAPLIYAATAEPRELKLLIDKLIAEKSMKVRTRKEWYHKMFITSLSLSGVLPAAAMAYMAAALIAHKVSPLEAALISIVASSIGYRITRSLVLAGVSGKINWRRLAKLGATTIITVLVFHIFYIMGIELYEGGLASALEAALFQTLSIINSSSFIDDILLQLGERLEYMYRLTDQLLSLILHFFLG